MANFSNDSEPENWNYNPYAADYACEFYFFSNDSNNWNYNPFINTPESERKRQREREREGARARKSERARARARARERPEKGWTCAFQRKKCPWQSNLRCSAPSALLRLCHFLQINK
jgi:hypothetical protein